MSLLKRIMYCSTVQCCGLSQLLSFFVQQVNCMVEERVIVIIPEICVREIR